MNQYRTTQMGSTHWVSTYRHALARSQRWERVRNGIAVLVTCTVFWATIALLALKGGI